MTFSSFQSRLREMWCKTPTSEWLEGGEFEPCHHGYGCLVRLSLKYHVLFVNFVIHKNYCIWQMCVYREYVQLWCSLTALCWVEKKRVGPVMLDMDASEGRLMIPCV